MGLGYHRLLMVLLIGFPCLLLVPLRKVARERPHFFRTEPSDIDITAIDFSRDGKIACAEMVMITGPESTASYDCWDTRTLKKLSSSQTDAVLYPPARRYGPLTFEDRITGGVFHHVSSLFVIEDGYSVEGPCLTLAERQEIIRWDQKKGRLLSRIVLKQPTNSDSSQDIGALSADGTICAVRKIDEEHSRYELLNCRSGATISEIPPRQSPGYPRCFFTSDSHTIIVWTSDQAEFFDVPTGKLLWTLTFSSPLENMNIWVEPRPTSDGLVGMPSKDGFDFYEGRTGNITRHLSHPALSEVTAWNFSPDGKQLWWATPDDNKILWLGLN